MPRKDPSWVTDILVDEWRELLPHEDVHADANIFSVGAHSLMIGRVASRCRSRHGLDLDFAWFFKYPVIRDLADFASSGQPD